MLPQIREQEGAATDWGMHQALGWQQDQKPGFGFSGDIYEDMYVTWATRAWKHIYIYIYIA